MDRLDKFRIKITRKNKIKTLNTDCFDKNGQLIKVESTSNGLKAF